MVAEGDVDEVGSGVRGGVRVLEGVLELVREFVGEPELEAVMLAVELDDAVCELEPEPVWELVWVELGVLVGLAM